MALKDDLMTVRGVGDATAEEILRVLDAHEGDVDNAVAENFREGYSYYQNGDYGYADKFFRRVAEALAE